MNFDAIALIERSGSIAGLQSLPFRDLHIADPGGTAIEQVASQRASLSTFVEGVASVDENGGSLFEELNGRIAENSTSEALFEQAFRNSPWPMQQTAT